MAAKKNERYPLRIQGYGSAGEGVARLEGQAVFVKGALRGELCQVHLLKVGKTAAWGKVDQVLEPSPGRQVPDCPRYPQCGGCQLRHMTYAEELAFKRQKVQDALQRIGGWEGEVTGIHGAKDPDRCRDKIQFPGAEGPKVGFFGARGRDVIEAPDCLRRPMAATRLRGAFRDWMAAHHIPAYDEKAHRGLLRHFYVRTNRKGQSLCAVIANGEALPQEAALVQALRQAEPNLVGVVLSVNREKTNVILGKTYRTLWGQDYLEDTLCGLEFRLSVPSFYQVNREQAEVLYGRALAFAGLTGRETVMDLYCGLGTITLVMARQAGRALGAEVIPAAAEDAQATARRTGVEQLTGAGMAPLEYKEVRGMEGVKEASYELPGKTVRVCVASGLHNVKRVLDGIRDGSLQYDFVEFMACPGGCINGGGQPIQHANVRNFTDIKALRAAALYRQDEGMTYRRSHENPVVQKVYADFLGEPGSHKAHALLHCSYIKQKRYRV